MKKIFMSIILTVYAFCVNAQVKEAADKLYAFLAEDSVSIYTNAFGKKIVTSLKNTSQDFYLVSLKKKKLKRFYVVINNVSDLDTLFYYGWINRSVVGITFSSANIELFLRPSLRSTSLQLKMPKGMTVATVLDFRKNGWIKCAFLVNNDSFDGWIPKKFQCFNLFTMCCGD